MPHTAASYLAHGALEPRRVNAVPEDRNQNGSGIKQGRRKQETVSEDTGTSGNSCYSLKEMLIPCL